MKWEDVKAELLKNPDVKREYEALELEYQIAKTVIEMRLRRRLTQRQLAARVKTKQPSIARLESGETLPSLRFLNEIARALDARIEIKLVPRDGRSGSA